MKKLFLLSIAFCIAIVAQAQVTITNLTAGDLVNRLSGQTGITNLVVSGTIDARDFRTVQKYKGTLESIDLSGISKFEAYSGTEGSAVSGSGITEYPANELPAYTFYQFTVLKTVILPTNAGLNSIGFQAFADATQLASVNIPTEVNTLRKGAFFGTTSLTVISPLNSLRSLEESVFASSGITQISLPEGITSIPVSTFQSCSKLEAFTVPSTVSSIGSLAFSGCSSLSNFIIPSNVTYIGSSAFMSTIKMQSFTFEPRSTPITINGISTFYAIGNTGGLSTFSFPENTIIENGTMGETFRQAGNLTSVNIPNSVTEIGDNTFRQTKLESISIPDGVIKLGTFVFYQVTTLESIKLPSTLISIGTACFSTGTTSTSTSLVESLELPATLTSIADRAFQNMKSLTSIKVHNPEPVIFATETKVFENINKETCILSVPSGTKGTANDYSEYDLWKDFKNIVEFSTPQTQTISNFSDITKTYSDADFTLGATASSGLDVSYAISEGNGIVAELLSDGKTVKILGAGTVKITASQAGNDNYEAAAPVEVTLTVNKAQQSISELSASLEAKTGDAPIALGATATSGLDVSYSIESGKEGVATLNGNVLTIIGVGTVKITASQVGNDNYEAATPVEVTLTVTAGSNIDETRNSSVFILTENPVKDEAYFSFESAENGARIVISDLTGKIVAQQAVVAGATEASISVSNLSSGVYVARYVDNSGEVSTIKFIK